jgi:hypothetical protein
MKLFKASLLVVASLLTGCVSLKSYVDTSFAHTRYEDLKRPSKPLTLKVNATIVEQMLLNALRDMQADGLLVNRSQEPEASIAEAGAVVRTAHGRARQ